MLLTFADRYARQIAVLGIGSQGQASIRSATVQVCGTGLDAEVCALYLAGAGVARLWVHPRLAPQCRALNSEVQVEARDEDGPLVQLYAPDAPQDGLTPPDEDPVRRGSLAARWALAKLLGG